jgi:hypothetical protein
LRCASARGYGRQTTRHRASVIGLVLALFATSAPAARAAPAPVAALGWAIETSRAVQAALIRDCFLTSDNGWFADGATWGTTAAGNPAEGAWDPAAGTGHAIEPAGAVLFDSFSQKFDHVGHAWSMDRVGVVLAGGQVRITATVRRAKSRLVAAPRRVTIATIAHPRFLSGAAHIRDRKGKLVGYEPNSFLMAVTGRATIASGYLAAVRRWRCRGKTANFKSEALRVGQPFGKVGLTIFPTAGTGQGGTLDLTDGPALQTQDDQTRVTVAPLAPAQTVTKQRVSTLQLPIAPGAAVPLTCQNGFRCEPTGGSMSLAGGLTLSLNGRTSTIAALAVSFAANGVPTLTGTLDGQPLTLQNGSTLTDDAVTRLSAALGAQLDPGSTLGTPTPSFTTTGQP